VEKLKSQKTAFAKLQK